MEGYDLKDLEIWDNRIQEFAINFGLDFFPQEFEICDYYQMLGYLAYSGMPSHYPHWSFGKSFEKQKTLYDYGVSGLPYEMVINSNPALAYLMKDNSLLLQILTIAHVYGHNDFFKNNGTFKYSYPERTIEKFKNHADRIRKYVEDPSIGLDEIEKFLDAAHAVSFNCNRNLGVKKLSRKEQQENIIKRAIPKRDEFSSLTEKQKYEPPDLTKNLLEPENDLLLFIRDNNPYLQDWQRDIFTIVDEETKYFIPQIETKIMNEGWASFWHYKILNVLELPQGLNMEFLVRHNQVLRPIPNGINPYRLGFKIFEDAEKRKGTDEIFLAREVCRDESFLRQYLTEELIRELNLFAHKKHDQNNREITDISDKDGWKKVKEVILKNTGLAALPVIKILDANYKNQQILYLLHEYDGRELDISYAEQTVKHIFTLWQKRIILESRLEGKPMFLSYDRQSESVKITYQLLS